MSTGISTGKRDGGEHHHWRTVSMSLRRMRITSHRLFSATPSTYGSRRRHAGTYGGGRKSVQPRNRGAIVRSGPGPGFGVDMPGVAIRAHLEQRGGSTWRVPPRPAASTASAKLSGRLVSVNRAPPKKLFGGRLLRRTGPNSLDPVPGLVPAFSDLA